MNLAIRYPILLLTLCSLQMACTTLPFFQADKAHPLEELKEIREPIVHETSGRSITSKLDRDSWIEIRKSTKSEQTKLYATLGAAEWDVAIHDARAYLQAHPGDEVALITLSTALAMKQNYTLAAYYATMLNTRHPGHPDVYNLIGLALMHKPGVTMNDLRAALTNFKTAFEANSQQIASGLNLAQLQLEMGNAQAARDTFQTVAKRCDDCPEATMGYGIALCRLGDFTQAERAFQGVLEEHPHHTYARFYLALVAKYGRNDNAAAVKHLSALLEDSKVRDLEIQRKANFLLRRTQAEIYARPKDASLPRALATSTDRDGYAEEQLDGDKLERLINEDDAP